MSLQPWFVGGGLGEGLAVGGAGGERLALGVEGSEPHMQGQ